MRPPAAALGDDAVDPRIDDAGAVVDGPDVARMVARAEFREERRGYEPAAVDDLLDTIVERAANGRSFVELIRGIDLPRTRRGGYAVDDVDRLLSSIGGSPAPHTVDDVGRLRRWGRRQR